MMRMMKRNKADDEEVNEKLIDCDISARGPCMTVCSEDDDDDDLYKYILM